MVSLSNTRCRLTGLNRNQTVCGMMKERGNDEKDASNKVVSVTAQGIGIMSDSNYALRRHEFLYNLLNR